VIQVSYHALIICRGTMEWGHVAVINTPTITVCVAVTSSTLVGSKDIDRRFLKNVALICNVAQCQ